MSGPLLLLSIFFLAFRRMPGATVWTRLARAAVLALALPSTLFAVLGTFGTGSSMPMRASALVLVLLALAFVGERRTGTDGSPWPALLAAGWVGLLAAGAFVVSPDRVLLDPLAHLAWSNDLPAARDFYPLGFPALVGVVSLDQPLFGAFRALPWLLHVAVALQFLAIGAARGWVGAGVFAALAYLLLPANASLLEPPVPEAFAVLLIAATWHEVWIARREAGRVGLRLGTLAFVTVLAHASVFEMAHLVAVSIAVLLGSAGASVPARIGRIAAMVIGTIVAVSASAFLRAILVGDDVPLLVSAQTADVRWVGIAGLAWSWGYAFSLALVATLAGLVVRWVRASDRAELARASVDMASPILAAVLLTLPVLLAAVGIEVGLQMFTNRLLLSAGTFLALAWTLALAAIGPLPRPVLLLTLLAFLAQLVHRVGLDPAGTALLAAAFTGLAVWLLREPRDSTFVETPRPRDHAAALALVVLFAGLIARAAQWWPIDPDWIEQLRAGRPRADLVVTNWPAVNWVDARGGVAVEDGLAGRDAGIALHRLLEIPPLHDRLLWCADRADSSAVILDDWLAATRLDTIDLVVHADFERAWTSGPEADASCEETAAERLARMRAAISSLPSIETTYASDRVTIHRWRRAPR